MTGAELSDARRVLGLRWGLGRPLFYSEMAQVLRLGGARPAEAIRDYEGGKPISGPISVCVELYLAGATPPDGLP